MCKKRRFFSVFLATAIFVSTLITPVFAVEPKGEPLCPYCWVSLTFQRQRNTSEIVNQTCQNAPTYVHKHTLYYHSNDYICPDCGYKVTIRTKYDEVCSQNTTYGRIAPAMSFWR